MAELVTFGSGNFAADPATRTLTGLLLPFGEVSALAKDPVSGQLGRYTFTEATTAVPEDPASVILNYGHDLDTLGAQVGVATALTKTPSGVEATFKIARTPEGDRVLALADAEVKILRYFSAEVEGTFSTGRDGVKTSVATTVVGGAVVRKPAFSGAAITNVAASAAQQEVTAMTDTAIEKEPAAPVLTFSAEDGAALRQDVQKLSEKLASLEDVKIPVGPGSPQFEVTEEPIYRFAGTEAAPSGFDFATDLFNAAKGDQAAFERVQKFSAADLKPERVQFANQPTTTANVASVNQPTYRPDMFMGQAPVPASPLYDFFYTGGLSNVTPFFWSKLDRTNTNIGVADHTEGVEPESRRLVTAVGATVTPTPVSGKVHITREVADQGGNPQISAMIKAEFDRSFAVALETKTAALISAAWSSISTLATIPTGTSGINAGLLLESGLIDLQFIPDGYRFERTFGHADLYKALALAANSSTGEKVYPILSPTNRDGTAASKFANLQIAGYGMYPTASLGAPGGTKNSLVADHRAVEVWNSGLQRLGPLMEDVEGWDLGVFAHFAGVVYDVTGLRKIVYTP